MTDSSATRNDVPDVTSSGINNSAKMVWQYVQAMDSFKLYASRGKHQGTPGRYWQGAVNQVINDLWPALTDRYLTQKEQAESVKLILNRFLRANNAMICIRDGGMVKKSTWFVSEYWPELTVTPGPPQDGGKESDNVSVVSDAAATESPTTVGRSAVAPSPLDVFSISRPAMAPATAVPEERSEEEMTSVPTPRSPMNESTSGDETAKHECRLESCAQKFEGVHHRATHEMKHGFRVNEDGTATNFDVNAPTPDEEDVQALIVKICEGREPMNRSQIVEAVRKDTPKAVSTTIKIVLQILVDEGWFNEVNVVDTQPGRVRRFKFLGEPPRKSSGKKTIKPIAQAVEETVDKLVGADESRIERYRGLLQELMADLTEIDELRAQIQRMEKSHEVVTESLRRVTEELIKVQADTSSSEELRRVTQERDELQGTLDTLKKVFGSALQ